jgi:hypothetical protein
MDVLKLVIPTGSLRRSKSGAIYGQVGFQLGTEMFPGPGWSDLAVAFLRAWILAIVRLCGSKTRSDRVRFMDGPYWTDLEKSMTDSDTVRVEFVCERLKGPIVQHSTTTSLGGLLHDAVQLGQVVLTACHEMGWYNSDIEELAESIRVATRLPKPHVS